MLIAASFQLKQNYHESPNCQICSFKNHTPNNCFENCQICSWSFSSSNVMTTEIFG